MSADLLARNCVKTLRDLRDDKVKTLRRCKPRPPTMMEGAVIPASGIEEIALFAVEVNATIDAFNIAIEAIEAEFKRMTSPEDPEVIVPPARSIY